MICLHPSSLRSSFYRTSVVFLCSFLLCHRAALSKPSLYVVTCEVETRCLCCCVEARYWRRAVHRAGWSLNPAVTTFPLRGETGMRVERPAGREALTWSSSRADRNRFCPSHLFLKLSYLRKWKNTLKNDCIPQLKSSPNPHSYFSFRHEE